MTISLTRFTKNPRSYKLVDSYAATAKSIDIDPVYSIEAYTDGLINNLSKFKNEPTAWSFSNWTNVKGSNNMIDNWKSSNAIVLEYYTDNKNNTPNHIVDTIKKLDHSCVVITGESREGRPTIAIVFLLSEAVNQTQYARLASVLSEEMNCYHAVSGNMSGTHLIHVNTSSLASFYDGKTIPPRFKINETKNAYQDMDCHRFEGIPPKPNITKTVTSDDGLFEWTETSNPALKSADDVLEMLGVTPTDKKED